VKRILFDENLPRLLRRRLPEFDIRTVQEEGRGAFKNGELLRLAENRFDVLLTADRRMQYQQTLTSSPSVWS
jgi:predicted nuclease of predicted toxin-antitoxin system